MIPFLNKKIFLTRTEEDNLNFQKCFNLLKPKYDPNKIFISAPLLDIFLPFDSISNCWRYEGKNSRLESYGIIAWLEVLK